MSDAEKDPLESLLNPKQITVADLKKAIAKAMPGIPIVLSVGAFDGLVMHSIHAEVTHAEVITDIYGGTTLQISSQRFWTIPKQSLWERTVSLYRRWRNYVAR